LLFSLDNDSQIEIVPTYSTNMNTTLGELEFKISTEQVVKLIKQKNNVYSIVIKNPDGTHYSYYEGNYFGIADKASFIENYTNTNLIAKLEAEIAGLTKSLKQSVDNYNRILAELKAQEEEAIRTGGETGGHDTYNPKGVQELSYLRKLNTDLTKKVADLTTENSDLTKQNTSLLAENDKLKNTSQDGRVVKPPNQKTVVVKPIKPKYDEDNRPV